MRATCWEAQCGAPRSRGRSDYAAIFSIFALMNFNSNSIGLSLDFAPLEQDARDGVEVAGRAGRMILTA